MKYISTRNKNHKVTAAQAILQGISEDGGLFLPEEVPSITLEDLKKLSKLDYKEIAVDIISRFLTDFTKQEVEYCVNSAYNTTAFADEKIAPLKKVRDGLYSLELWHGSTSAFKDMALQILPYLLTISAKKMQNEKKIVILVATSGDTGKAALEGFKDVDGTQIIVFYPNGGVSPVQYLQMATQEGKNVAIYAVEGNFDDTQTAVKEMFTDEKLREELAESNLIFSSANSINWGRLLPQIVYYVSSYCQLVASDQIDIGDKINLCVPTGNFGNILAAYYAKLMGVPINKLICASNENNVLTDFIKTGVYNTKRKFMLTVSPSMDIVISSNLERLLYLLSEDDKLISQLMDSLKKYGEYTFPKNLHEKLSSDFYGSFCNEQETFETINKYNNSGYLCDTHTAVAFNVYDKYIKDSSDQTTTIVVSTANPYKFSQSMLKALGYTDNYDGFQSVHKLQEVTGLKLPEQIAVLETKEKRFTAVIKREDMLGAVKKEIDL